MSSATKCWGKVQKIGEETLKTRFSELLPHVAHLFGLMWSTHASWLQHMPALSKVVPEFSISSSF
jgi:hypothetical protein